MKKQILFFLSIIGIGLNFASCSTDDIVGPTDTSTDMVRFDVELPAGELRTRSYGDGESVSNLKCYIYSVDAELPMRTETVALTSSNGKRGGSLGIDLPSGGTYDFVFLATSCSQDDKASKVYYNPTNRTLNLNYSKITGNDEDVDCFFGVLPSISIDKGQSHSATLKRPYAQLNIGTKDMEVYNKMASAPLTTVGVSVDGVYTSMNVMDGNCVGSPVKVSIPAAALPSGQTFPAKDAAYLAMDYLLVKGRKDVTVSLTASNGVKSFSCDFADIPIQRNYQTVVYGNLLTAEKDFTVEINPEFTSSGNKDMDDPWGEYDLVLQAIDNCSSSTRPEFLTLCYTDDQNQTHEINLINYLDSKKMVKLTWDELGVHKVNHLYFKIPTYSSNYIKALYKCDIDKIGATDLSNFLEGSVYIENIQAVEKWEIPTVCNTNRMFFNCRKLKKLSFHNFNTSNVSDMSTMFGQCYELVDLDISCFDTSNVTSMGYMFSGCQALSQLDVSHFDTSNVTDMTSMFSGCQALGELDVSHFDTSNVTDMTSMFDNCRALSELDVSHFDTSNVKSMASMFNSCRTLSQLDVSHFDTSNVTSMASMFSGCHNIATLDLSSFDTTNVKSMTQMFSECTALSSVNLSSFITEKVTSMSSMFMDCSTITQLDLSSFFTPAIIDTSEMFLNCSNLRLLDISNFTLPENAINRKDMYKGCPGNMVIIGPL